MDMTKFRYFECRNLGRPGLNRFYLITLKKMNITTNLPRFGYLVQGSINIESMSEIDFFAVFAILMITSEFY